MNDLLASSEEAEASLYYKEMDSIIGPLTLCATACSVFHRYKRHLSLLNHGICQLLSSC
jgi:hypothetical protein